MKRLAYLLTLALASAVSLNLMVSSAGASSNPLTIVYPSIDHQRFDKGPVTIGLRIEGGNTLGFRASLNGKDVTSLFGPHRSGRMRAVFTAEYLKHGVNNFEAKLGSHKVWRSFKVKSLRTDAAAGGPIRPGPLQQPGADLWIPIQTRIISGDGANPSDYAIKVGDTTYTAQPPSDGSGSATGYQVLLLDRATLEPIYQHSNVSYPAATQSSLTSLYGISGNLKGCGENGCLMVVQSLQTIGYTPWPCLSIDCQYEVNSPGSFFGQLGGSFNLNSANGTTPHTGYSLIANVGPSGAPTGTGYERLTCNQAIDCGGFPGDEIITAAGASAISGALVKDNNLAYTFAYPGRATFSTGTGDLTTQNTITIGATTNGLSYQSDTIPNGFGAFHVVVIYRDSLQLVYQKTFNFDQLDSMTSALEDVRDHGNYLVLISSIGNLWHDNWFVQWANVGKAIERLGGTYSLFVSLQSGDDYSFVGATDTTLGNGAAEASSVITNEIKPVGAKLKPSNIWGKLAQDRQGNYEVAQYRLHEPDNGDTKTDPSFADFGTSLLDAFALQAPTPWPASDTPGKQAAYIWFSQRVSSPDIRSDYTTEDKKDLFGGWASTILNSNYPSSQSFTEDEFKLVQQQLCQELTSVSEVWGYTDGILEVYSEKESDDITILNNAVTDIKSSINANSNTLLSTKWSTVYASAQTIVGDIAAVSLGPETKLAVDSFFVIGKLGVEFSQNAYGAQMQNLEYTFEQLETQTSDNLKQHRTVLENLRDLILTDWGRLQALGTPLTNDTIVWDTKNNVTLQKLLERTFRREVFTKLIGASFELGHWTNIAEGATPPNVGVLCTNFTHFCSARAQGTCVQTSCNTPDSHKENWIALPSSNARVGQNYDIWLIGSDVRCSAGKNGGLLGPLFAPLDPDDATKLGIYKPYFFLHPADSIKVRTNESCSD